MPKRTEILRILIIGSALAVIIVTCSLLMVRFAAAECVTVYSETPKYEPSFRHARITIVQNGKPLKDAVVQLYIPGVQGSSSPLINDNGTAMLPKLRPGKYCVIATAKDTRSAGVCLDVSLSAEDKTTVLSIDVPSKPTWPDGPELAAAEKMPIGNRLRDFSGTVQDESGAVVSGAEIDVLSKGSENKKYLAQIQSDHSGRFSTHLAEGTYIAFFRMSAFRTHIAVFEVVREAGSKDLLITLKVGGC